MNGVHTSSQGDRNPEAPFERSACRPALSVRDLKTKGQSLGRVRHPPLELRRVLWRLTPFKKAASPLLALTLPTNGIRLLYSLQLSPDCRSRPVVTVKYLPRNSPK